MTDKRCHSREEALLSYLTVTTIGETTKARLSSDMANFNR
jgi:hypothetical protein